MSKKEKDVRVLCNCEWRHSLSILPLENRARVYDAILEYAETGDIPQLELVEKVAFEPIRKEIGRYMDNYKETCEKRKERAIEREKQKKEQGTTTYHKCAQVCTNDHNIPQDPTNPNPSPNPNPNPNVPNGTNNNISCRRINSSMSKTSVFDDETETEETKTYEEGNDYDKNTDATSIKYDEKKGKEIIRYYNNQIVTHKARLRSCRIISEKRMRLILARLNECGEERVKKVIDNAIASSFLNYEASNAPVDLEWIMRPNNFAKVYEGKYENRPPRPSRGRNSKYYDPIDNKHINDKWK